MRVRIRACLYFFNLFLLMGLLFVRLDGQRLFIQGQDYAVVKKQLQYDLNEAKVTYYQLVAGIPNKMSRKGLIID